MKHRFMLGTTLAALALGILSACGKGSLVSPLVAEESSVSDTAQAHLLLVPSADPESLLGRAVHMTGDNVWTIAQSRAAGCDVTVKRMPSRFDTRRNVQLSSLTALAGGLPQLIEIEGRYGRRVTVHTKIQNTEIYEADVSPRYGDIVVDRVFVGSGRRQLMTQSDLGGAASVTALAVSPSVSHEESSKIVDSTEWREPMAYGFATRNMQGITPLDLDVSLPTTVQDGQAVSVTIRTSKKAWLIVFYQESDGRAALLWPSAQEPEPVAEPNHPAVLPSSAERNAGIRIQAQLHQPDKPVHELFVVYAFSEKTDWERFKPTFGAESTEGAAYVSEITNKINDLSMARWSRAILAYTIVPASL